MIIITILYLINMEKFKGYLNNYIIYFSLKLFNNSSKTITTIQIIILIKPIPLQQRKIRKKKLLILKHYIHSAIFSL